MTPLHGAGPQTAGMLRISKGQEERHVWPVHLPGWLAIGWRVVAATVPAPTADLFAAALAQEHKGEPESNAKTASPRSKRGRKPREELTPQPAAEPALLPQPNAAADQESPLSALPEGLLDDPLI
jgi:hypothetical protein